MDQGLHGTAGDDVAKRKDTSGNFHFHNASVSSGFNDSTTPTLRPPLNFTDLMQSNYNPYWTCGPVNYFTLTANVNKGSYFGSFQELLRNASCGELHFDNNVIPDLGGIKVEDDTGRVEDVGMQNNGKSVEVEDESGKEDDDGYLGGQEWDGESSGLENSAPAVNESRFGLEFDLDHENNSGGGLEKYNGLDIDSDADEEIEAGQGGVQCPHATGSHLGDCGCITGNEHGEDGGASADDIDSDSSDDEDDISIEVDLKQEIYINRDQIGVPYKKRKRAPKNVNRPNCRKPRLMGAVERALRSASTRDTEHIFEPILGMVFDSRQEAKEFYNMYSWEVGFGVKYNTSRPGSKNAEKNAVGAEENEEPYVSMQEIVCQKSGSDSRTKRTKRCGCPAKIRLLRTDDHGWYITFIESIHNHPFSRTAGQKREWNSHREIDPTMKQVIRDLRQNNINLTKVHCVLGSMFGSMGDVPWTKRSLRTVCNQIRKDQMDDDIKKTMEIFREMHEKDSGFQFSVELDKRSRIRTLLWCSGRAHEQYQCFGDVVTFDTTYCTNIYKMSFGLFVGVNNHFQTTIFGGVLMRRETTKSFKWVFKEFLTLMGGKAPLTILTDQCKAMTKAISIVMPDTYHLWCKWHVMKKIRECLGPLYTKNKKFRDEFWLVVNGMLTEDEFEAAWAAMIKKYKLEENAFMKRVYNCKTKWAKPWSKDKFCARMSSTQRSESANFMLKRFVPRNSSMNQFVSQYNRLLYERDREEDIAEHKTKQLHMVHSRLWAIERHALKVYTKAAFELFRLEVDKASNYGVSKQEGNIYTITHDSVAKRAHWARVHFKVERVGKGERYICECGLYEHFGIMCSHSIRLLLKLDVCTIPEAHIMKRWTRDARDVLSAPLEPYQKDQEAILSSTFRNRLLRVQSGKVIATGDMDVELFEIAMKHLKATEKESAEVLVAREKKAQELQEDDSSDDEDEVDVEQVDGQCTGVQSDGEMLKKNKYGASGSSARYSDSEIAKIKAPVLRIVGGRPRSRRLIAGSERSKKKWKKNNSKKRLRSEFETATPDEELVGQCSTNTTGDVNAPEVDNEIGIATGAENSKKSKKTKKTKKSTKSAKHAIKCGKCGLDGHNAMQCCSIEITNDTAGAYL